MHTSFHTEESIFANLEDVEGLFSPARPGIHATYDVSDNKAPSSPAASESLSCRRAIAAVDVSLLALRAGFTPTGGWRLPVNLTATQSTGVMLESTAVLR